MARIREAEAAGSIMAENPLANYIRGRNISDATAASRPLEPRATLDAAPPPGTNWNDPVDALSGYYKGLGSRLRSVKKSVESTAEGAVNLVQHTPEIAGGIVKGVGQMAEAFLPAMPRGSSIKDLKVPPGYAAVGRLIGDLAQVTGAGYVPQGGGMVPLNVVMSEGPDPQAVDNVLRATNTAEAIRLGKRIAKEGPTAVLSDEPLSVLGTTLGLVTGTGMAASILGNAASEAEAISRAGRIFRTAELVSRTYGNVKEARSVLQELGAGRRVSKAMASRLSRVRTPEEVQSILADAVRLSTKGKSRTLAISRRVMANNDIRAIADEAKAAQDAIWSEHRAFSRQAIDEANARREALTGKVTELEEAFNKAPTPEARDQILREYQLAEFRAKRGATNIDADRLAAIRKARAKAAAQAKKIEEQAARRVKNLASVPDDPTPTIEQFERALKHQYNVNKATSLQDAHLTGIDRHTPADLADMPITDPFGPDGRLIVTRLDRAKLFMAEHFGTPERIKASVTRLFGRESQLLSGTPQREEFIVAIKDADTYKRTLEATAKVVPDEILRTLTKEDLNWWDAEFVRNDGTVTTNGREWMRQGRPAEWQGAPVPGQLQELGNAFQREYEALHAAATKAGRKWDPQYKLGDIEHYVPNQITSDARLALLAGRGDHYEALFQWARENKKVKELRGIQDQINPREGVYPTRRSSSIDFKRELDLPAQIVMPNGDIFKVLETDPIKSFYRYVDDVTRRIATIEHFGFEGERAKQLILNMGDDFFGRGVAHDVWKSFQGIPESPGAYNSLWGRGLAALEMGARTAQLSASVLPNTSGQAWVARKWGLRHTIEANKIIHRATNKIAHPEEWAIIEAHRALGGISEEVLNYLGETEMASRGGVGLERMGHISRKSLGWTGLKGVEGRTNAVAGIAARRAVKDYLDIIRNGERSRWSKITGVSADAVKRELKRDFLFSDSDIRRMANSGLAEEDIARIVQTAPALVNAWRVGATSKYRLLRHPVFQPVFAYTSWVRARGHMVADAVRELKHGNFKPFLKELGYSTAAGEYTIALKNFLKNRERTDEGLERVTNDWLDAGTFGFWGAIYESLKYGPASTNPVDAGVKILIPPALDWSAAMYSMVSNAVKAIKNNDPEAEQKAYDNFFRALPIAKVGQGMVMRATEPFGDPLNAAARRHGQAAQQRYKRLEEQLEDLYK